MTPIDLPYILILLNETFITALWDTGAEKSFISEEVYRKHFSYRPRQKTKHRVVTAQGLALRMPFGLSGAAPNFQKAIDVILKPVIGRFVSVYMDDVIITSPSFNEHLAHLNQVFTLLTDAGLTLNKDKCHFARDKLKYLGLVISKEGIKIDHSKVKAITEMKPPKNSKEVSKFLGMAGLVSEIYTPVCRHM
ncbi:retrovirus-related Pol polyprotein from transposon 297 [Trichonephila clavipes]|nr:retrovirus-related Pol polyprotein from transposon 297 [Trichonephila clavipes]